MTDVPKQGPPTPGHVRSRAAQQEMTLGERGKLHLVAVPRHSKLASDVTVSCLPRQDCLNCRKPSSGLPLILHHGELYDYFTMYHSIIAIEIKCTINVLHLNHPSTLVLVCGKTVFHETGSWCQKGWGPYSYLTKELR